MSPDVAKGVTFRKARVSWVPHTRRVTAPWILPVLISACVVGCATTSLPLTNLTPVPPERFSWQQRTEQPIGTLLVARDVGLAGFAARRVVVTVDGKAAGNVFAGEFLRLFVEPGRRVVAASATAAIGGETRSSPRQLEIDVPAGGEIVVRVGFGDLSTAGGFYIWLDATK